MKINFIVRQTSHTSVYGKDKITVHLRLGLILDGMASETVSLHFQAEASTNREDIPTLSNVYADSGLDLPDNLKDEYWFGPWRWDGANIDNLGGLIAQNTDRFNRLLKAWAKKVHDANLYHRHGSDDLAVWLDALHRMKATQVNSEYDQTPVAIAATAK